MGATAFLTVKDFVLDASSREVPSHYSFLFQEREKYWECSDCEELAIGYHTDVGKARKRLSLIGFTLEQCKEKFELRVRSRVQTLQSRLSEITRDEDGFVEDSPELEMASVQLDLLKELTFEGWTNSLRWLLENECLSTNELKEYLSKNSKDLIQDKSVVKALDVFLADEETFLDASEPRMLWGALLSTFASSDSINLDLSELVNAELLTIEDRVIDDGWDALRKDIVNLEPVVILTEGSSDASILKMSLDALYPEVKERFQFLDFASTKYPGGAPSLVTQLKGFAAAKVRIKILGIVDNDAAGREALRILKNVSLPSNISFITLPSLPLAENYPAIGPLDQQTGNVNELAVSIEFFAGEKLLREVGGGELVPVVWKSYMSGINSYQGELEKKTTVAELLRDSLSQKKEPDAHQLAHPELRLLWEEIFKQVEMLA